MDDMAWRTHGKTLITCTISAHSRLGVTAVVTFQLLVLLLRFLPVMSQPSSSVYRPSFQLMFGHNSAPDPQAAIHSPNNLPIIVKGVLQHEKGQSLPKFQLRFRSHALRSAPRICSVRLRNCQEESKLTMGPPLSLPNICNIDWCMPPLIVIVHPMLRSIV